MNKQFTIALFISMLCFSFAEAKPKKSKTVTATVATVVKDTVEFKNKVDTVSYFIGLQIGSDMTKNGATDINSKAMEKG